MTAAEILEKVKAGETVRIPAGAAGTFMRECEVHNLTCSRRNGERRRSLFDLAAASLFAAHRAR